MFGLYNRSHKGILMPIKIKSKIETVLEEKENRSKEEIVKKGFSSKNEIKNPLLDALKLVQKKQELEREKTKEFARKSLFPR